VRRRKSGWWKVSHRESETGRQKKEKRKRERETEIEERE
jgi:hypothetical protein